MEKDLNIIEQSKRFIIDVLYIFKEELKLCIHDQGVLIFCLVVPMIYPLLYTYIYNNEVVREMPCVVVDNNKSSLSREYIRMIDATPDLKVISRDANIDEARTKLMEHKAWGIVYIPQDFSKKINRGEQASVSVYADMSCMLNYKAMKLGSLNTALAMGDKIKIKRFNKWDEASSELAIAPVKTQGVALFNGSKGFASFVMPAVLMLVIQQTLILGIGLAAGSRREKKKEFNLKVFNKRNKGTLRILFGKTACYLLIYSIISLYVLYIAPKLFNLNQLTDIPTLFMFTLPYLLACIFFAITVSVVVHHRETVMLIFVFASILLLFISGISWPTTSIPVFWKWVAKLFPSTPGINGFVAIQNMGADLHIVKKYYQSLWVMTGIYFVAAYLTTRYMNKKANN
ncbi:MAG: ABC transporter permease [Bacteroidaceae bacterium]